VNSGFQKGGFISKKEFITFVVLFHLFLCKILPSASVKIGGEFSKI
jgi:hypothetical protein